MKINRKLVMGVAFAVVLAGSAAMILSGELNEEPMIQACREAAYAAGRIVRRNNLEPEFTAEQTGEGRWTVTSGDVACEVVGEGGARRVTLRPAP